MKASNQSMKLTVPLRNTLTHSLPLFRPSAFPIYVAPLPAGSIQRVCHDTLPWLISFSLDDGAPTLLAKVLDEKFLAAS